MSNFSDNPPIHTKITTNFKNDIVKALLKNQLSNPKTKSNEDAINLLSELSKMLVIEATVRAAKQTKTANKTTITLEDVEIILPQLMLDFP